MGTTSNVRIVDVITPPMTATPSGLRKSAPSPLPSAIGNIPATSANVVIRIGRRRIAPASISAVRSDTPPCSRCHFAKSISRIAFFATIPASRITPISDIRLIVIPVIANAPNTPISDSGSERRIAIGSRKLPNCNTRIMYINTIAIPSAAKIEPKTFC